MSKENVERWRLKDNIEFLIILMTLIGSFVWNQVESKDFHNSMKEFHGRLCTLEERYLQMMQRYLEERK